MIGPSNHGLRYGIRDELCARQQASGDDVTFDYDATDADP